MYVSICKASKILGVSISTLRRWETEDTITPAFRTSGGHRRYSLESISRKSSQELSLNSNRYAIAYARVSSHDQKEDLIRQGQRLSHYCETHQLNYELLSDLGSGINYKKKGLNKLIVAICQGDVSTLILTHRDRLLRFSSPLLFKLCDIFGTKVIILDRQLDKSFEQELVSDVIEIMTVFTARIHGKRSHRNKQALAA